ncbi:MAG: hypothetical protein ABIX28_01175, partial [Vicinamibacterales bacterium]
MAMLLSPRRLRRRERARRRRFVVGALIALVLMAGSLVRLSRLPPPLIAEAPSAAARPTELVAMPTEPVDETATAGEQPSYPYSIIPGGAKDVEALRAAIDADPVVRAHYANFDLAKVRVVRLTEPRVAHVSYRLGDHVFWTRRPLPLKADETLLTDGVHYARTRCGNQLATAPGAISGAEPSPEALDTPTPLARGARVFPTITLPGSVIAPSGAGGGLSGMTLGGGSIQVGSQPTEPLLAALAPGPQFFGSSVGLALAPPPSTSGLSDPGDPLFDDDPSERTPDDPPTRQVPEPGLTLLIIGGGALWARRLRRRQTLI